jgi:hypothetical protein
MSKMRPDSISRIPTSDLDTNWGQVIHADQYRALAPWVGKSFQQR